MKFNRFTTELTGTAIYWRRDMNDVLHLQVMNVPYGYDAVHAAIRERYMPADAIVERLEPNYTHRLKASYRATRSGLEERSTASLYRPTH